MIAELYCDLGFFRRAEAELKRVSPTDEQSGRAQVDEATRAARTPAPEGVGVPLEC